MGIAEHLGLPVIGINVPGHLALRWDLGNGRYFNWETTVPARCKDDFYISWKNISKDAVRKGVYIKQKGLSKQELIAHVYYDKGLVLKEWRHLDGAMAALDRATELFPQYADAYNLKGVILKGRGEIRRAVGEYDRAIGLDPNFPEAYYNRANAKLEMGDYEGTKRDLMALKTLDAGLAERLQHLVQ
jgi:tetratricopeptide (TPR) repeat protein